MADVAVRDGVCAVGLPPVPRIESHTDEPRSDDHPSGAADARGRRLDRAALRGRALARQAAAGELADRGFVRGVRRLQRVRGAAAGGVERGRAVRVDGRARVPVPRAAGGAVHRSGAGHVRLHVHQRSAGRDRHALYAAVRGGACRARLALGSRAIQTPAGGVGGVSHATGAGRAGEGRDCRRTGGRHDPLLLRDPPLVAPAAGDGLDAGHHLFRADRRLVARCGVCGRGGRGAAAVELQLDPALLRLAPFGIVVAAAVFLDDSVAGVAVDDRAADRVPAAVSRRASTGRVLRPVPLGVVPRRTGLSDHLVLQAPALRHPAAAAAGDLQRPNHAGAHRVARQNTPGVFM